MVQRFVEKTTYLETTCHLQGCSSSSFGVPALTAAGGRDRTEERRRCGEWYLEVVGFLNHFLGVAGSGGRCFGSNLTILYYILSVGWSRITNYCRSSWCKQAARFHVFHQQHTEEVLENQNFPNTWFLMQKGEVYEFLLWFFVSHLTSPHSFIPLTLCLSSSNSRVVAAIVFSSTSY